MKSRIAVLGGGFSGLELAVHLSLSKFDIEVIEIGPAIRVAHVDWDRTFYPGDEKTRRWTSDGWGLGGGLSERLGGRSLCYHGVFLGMNLATLEEWPTDWQRALSEPDGLYHTVQQELEHPYPFLLPRPLSSDARALGLEHVPQAGNLDRQTGRFSAYSPLAAARELNASTDNFTIVRAAARALHRQSDGAWVVDVVDASGESRERGPFDYCVLAASAIGNVQLLAASLKCSIETRITDHFCVGALVRLEPGEPLDEFLHPRIWTGFTRLPDESSNLFIQELPHLPNGDRVVELFAVIEQGGSAADYSKLFVEESDRGELLARARIETSLSVQDEERLQRVNARVLEMAHRIARGDLQDVTEEHRSTSSTNEVLARGDEVVDRNADVRWLGKDHAYEALLDGGRPGLIARFQLPYGSFEHECCSHPLASQKTPAITADLEVEGLPGVYVVGPGAFPRLGAANPALTLVCLSRRLAANLNSG